MSLKKVILGCFALVLSLQLCSCNNENSIPSFPVAINETENNSTPDKAQLFELSSYSYKYREASYKINGSINSSSVIDVDYFVFPLKYNSNVDITFSCEDNYISFTLEKLNFDTFSSEDKAFLSTKETLFTEKNIKTNLSPNTYYLKVEDLRSSTTNEIIKYTIDINFKISDVEERISLTKAYCSKNIDNFVWVNDLVSFSGRGIKKLDTNYKLNNSDDDYKDYLISSMYKEFGSKYIPAFEFYIFNGELLSNLLSIIDEIKEKISDITHYYEIKIEDYKNVGLSFTFANRSISISTKIPTFAKDIGRNIKLDSSTSDYTLYFLKSVVENIFINFDNVQKFFDFYELKTSIKMNFFYYAKWAAYSEGTSYVKFTIYMQIFKEGDSYYFKYIFKDLYDLSEGAFIDEETDCLPNIIKREGRYYSGSFKAIREFSDYNNISALASVNSLDEIDHNPTALYYDVSMSYRLYYNQYAWFSFTPEESKKYYILCYNIFDHDDFALDEYEEVVRGYSTQGLISTHRAEYKYMYSEKQLAIIVEIDCEAGKTYYFKERSLITGSSSFEGNITVTKEFPSFYVER